MVKRKSRLMMYILMTIKSINGDCTELRYYINGGDKS